VVIANALQIYADDAPVVLGCSGQICTAHARTSAICRFPIKIFTFYSDHDFSQKTAIICRLYDVFTLYDL